LEYNNNRYIASTGEVIRETRQETALPLPTVETPAPQAATAEVAASGASEFEMLPLMLLPLWLWLEYGDEDALFVFLALLICT